MEVDERECPMCVAVIEHEAKRCASCGEKVQPISNATMLIWMSPFSKSLAKFSETNSGVLRSITLLLLVLVATYMIGMGLRQTKSETLSANSELADLVPAGKEGSLVKGALIFDSPESEDLMNFAISVNDKTALEKLEAEGRLTRAQADSKVLVLKTKPGGSNKLTQVRMLDGSLQGAEFWVPGKDLRRR